MLRAAPRTTVLVSLLALSSYLAAALLDCERPLDADWPEAARIAGWSGPEHGSAEAVHASDATRAAGTHAHPRAREDGHDQGHGHGHGHGHDARRPTSSPADPEHHAAHGHHAPAAPVEAPAKVRRRGDAPDRVLTATCLCGCSETRAKVGGNASRLGATIPGAFVETLLPRIVRDGGLPDRSSPAELGPPRDPIPI